MIKFIKVHVEIMETRNNRGFSMDVYLDELLDDPTWLILIQLDLIEFYLWLVKPDST